MLSFHKISIFTLLFFFFLVSGISAQNVKEKRVENWIGDIDLYAQNLPKRHKNLFVYVKKEDFESVIEELKSRVKDLSDEEIFVELKKITARFKDAHTSIYTEEYKVYPITLKYFSDDLRVISSLAEDKEILGERLVKIGQTDIKIVGKLIGETVSTENEFWLKYRLPQSLIQADLLRGTGILMDVENAEFTFEDESGKQTVKRFSPISLKEVKDKEWKPILEKSERSLYQQNGEKYYWFEYLEESKTLYLAYNRCYDEKEKPFKEFIKEVFAVADKMPIEKFVIDMRRNGGGNSEVINPLHKYLKKRPKLYKKKNLFVLMGNGTFSSGVLNSLRLKKDFGAIWVGEPSGQKLNIYGNIKTFELPNSKLTVTYSISYFPFGKMFAKSLPNLPEDASFIPVEVPVEITWEDYKAGRDPVLQKALDYKMK